MACIIPLCRCTTTCKHFHVLYIYNIYVIYNICAIYIDCFQFPVCFDEWISCFFVHLCKSVYFPWVRLLEMKLL